jgi:hypothetical protein
MKMVGLTPGVKDSENSILFLNVKKVGKKIANNITAFVQLSDK